MRSSDLPSFRAATKTGNEYRVSHEVVVVWVASTSRDERQKKLSTAALMMTDQVTYVTYHGGGVRNIISFIITSAKEVYFLGLFDSLSADYWKKNLWLNFRKISGK